MFLIAKGLFGNVVVFLLFILLSSVFTQPAHSREKLCPSGHQDRGGLAGELCYKHCKPNFHGIATTCWEECPSGLADAGLFCSDAGNIKVVGKQSYGRGVGSPLRCADGQQRNGALCYPHCRSGYHGVGPVCWGSCPEGTDTDFGATCTKWATWKTKKVLFVKVPYISDWGWTKPKPSYGRGAGVPLSSCKDDQEKDGALCYPKCKSDYRGVGPVCWKKCPSEHGWHDDGALCRFDRGFLKSTYDRGVGVVPDGRSYSFRNTYVPEKNENFSIVVMSDPQFSWTWHSEGHPFSNRAVPNDADLNVATEIYNGRMVDSINKLSRVNNIRFVVINGDLTAFGRSTDISRYQSFYNSKFKYARQNVINLPVYIGLGNHDYQNNYNDCTDNVTLQWDRCANNMINLIRGSVFKNYTGNAMFKDNIESYDEHSLSYSWNKGKFHFIQLHDYPETRNDSVGSPLAWLEEDLTYASQRGQYVIINMHEFAREQSARKDAELSKFIAVLEKYNNIAAIYSGHIHDSVGYLDGEGKNKIPHYRSGSAIKQTYLKVDFYPNKIVTTVIDAKDTNLVPYALPHEIALPILSQ